MAQMKYSSMQSCPEVSLSLRLSDTIRRTGQLYSMKVQWGIFTSLPKQRVQWKAWICAQSKNPRSIVLKSCSRSCPMDLWHTTMWTAIRSWWIRYCNNRKMQGSSCGKQYAKMENKKFWGCSFGKIILWCYHIACIMPMQFKVLTFPTSVWQRKNGLCITSC